MEYPNPAASELIRALKSKDMKLRDDAVTELKHTGWLYDSSLTKANLQGANLEGVDMQRATFREVNLSGANLRDSKLTAASFQGANLQNANLNSASIRSVRFAFANLTGVELIGSDAGWANFAGADLTGAICYGAAFWSTDLTNANLTNVEAQDVNLRSAKLVSTVLEGTKLQGASIGETVFAGVDLRPAIGLTELEHWKPCFIDIDTLYRSQANIPRSFLHKCGIPDAMIEYMQSIVESARAIDFYKVFISFSSQDNVFADQLLGALEGEGVRGWKYDREQHVGEGLYDNIDRGLKLSEKIVFISSNSSWQSQSVREEIEYALQQEKRLKTRILLPVIVDDALSNPVTFLESIIANRIYADFRGWERNSIAFEMGVRQLISSLEKPESSDPS